MRHRPAGPPVKRRRTLRREEGPGADGARGWGGGAGIERGGVTGRGVPGHGTVET